MTAAHIPLLEARALRFLRQDEPVFGPLHFQLHAGELALVEGDNGSGKTTLMRVLAGLLHLDEGELHWRGVPLGRLSAGQRKRAALARLLLVPATLWLLDEPYANLDRHGIALVNRLLETHIASGGAALVTSHGAVSFHGGEPQRIRMHA